MKRNLFLVFAILISVLLIVKSTNRILGFRNTSIKVEEASDQLEQLRLENALLKRELDYKKSKEFVEAEIRNKLGLAKEGETVVILPLDRTEEQNLQTTQNVVIPNWQKWRNLFFGT